MSKQVNMIAGFEALRGNISGKQTLQYPKDGKGAYESVMNKKNYATNYRTSYVVAKRASDGLVYFQVRQRSCNHLTAKSKKAMAVLGGTGAIVGAILANKSAALYTNLVGIYEYSVDHGDNRTFRQFLHASISGMLKDKEERVTITNMGGSATIVNPWGRNPVGAVTISQAVYDKFLDELFTTPMISITVDGTQYTMPDEYTWADYITSRYNPGNFSRNTEDDTVLYNGSTLYNTRNEIYTDEDVIANSVYSTIAPN